MQGVPVRLVRGHHSTSKRPLSRWRGHVSSASMLAPTDVWPLRVPLTHVCMYMLAAATAHMSGMHTCFSAATESLSGVARRSPIPPAHCGTSAARAALRPGRKGSQGVHRNPRLAASEGWIGLSSPLPRCGLHLPLPRRVLPPGCVPPRPLQQLPTLGAVTSATQQLPPSPKIRTDPVPSAGRVLAGC